MQFAGKPIDLKEIKLYGESVETTESVKYLGVVLDRGLRFKQHLKQIERKANVLINCTSWYLRAEHTLHYAEKMMLYKCVFLPTLLYGWQIWSHALDYEVNRRTLRRLQRRFLINILGAYRTISYDCTYELTDTVAIDLEVAYRQACQIKLTEENRAPDKEEKKDYRAAIREEQRKFFRERSRVKVKDEIDYRSELTKEMVYIMSAHGPMQKYLADRRLAEDPTCRLCLEEDEDVAHFQAGCPGLDFILNVTIEDENQLTEFRYKCKELFRRLRGAATN